MYKFWRDRVSESKQKERPAFATQTLTAPVRATHAGRLTRDRVAMSLAEARALIPELTEQVKAKGIKIPAKELNNITLGAALTATKTVEGAYSIVRAASAAPQPSGFSGGESACVSGIFGRTDASTAA